MVYVLPEELAVDGLSIIFSSQKFPAVTCTTIDETPPTDVSRSRRDPTCVVLFAQTISCIQFFRMTQERLVLLAARYFFLGGVSVSKNDSLPTIWGSDCGLCGWGS